MNTTAEPNNQPPDIGEVIRLTMTDYLFSTAGVEAVSAGWYIRPTSCRDWPAHQVPRVSGFVPLEAPMVVRQVLRVLPGDGPEAANANASYHMLISNAFLHESERGLRRAGFSPVSSQALSYLRLHLALASAMSASIAPEDGGEAMIAPVTPIGKRVSRFNEELYRDIGAAWPRLLATVMYAYHINGGAFSAATVEYCKKQWKSSSWPGLLRSCELEWPQVFDYGFRGFSYRALVLILTTKLVAGDLAWAPVFEATFGSEVEDEVTPVYTSWSAEHVKQWWSRLRGMAMVNIMHQKATIMQAASGTEGAEFDPQTLEWARMSLDPIMDLVRVMIPYTLQHIGAPPVSVKGLKTPDSLADQGAEDVVYKLSDEFGNSICHVESMASVPLNVAAAYNNSFSTASTRLLDWVKDNTRLVLASVVPSVPTEQLTQDLSSLSLIQYVSDAALGVPAGTGVRAQLISEPPAAAFMRATTEAATTQPIAPSAAARPSSVRSVDSEETEAYLDAHWEAPAMGAFESLPPPVPRASKPAHVPNSAPTVAHTVSGRVAESASLQDPTPAESVRPPSPSRLGEVEAAAFREAKGWLRLETYTDKRLLEFCLRGDNPSWTDRHARPELVHAREAFRRALARQP